MFRGSYTPLYSYHIVKTVIDRSKDEQKVKSKGDQMKIKKSVVAYLVIDSLHGHWPFIELNLFIWILITISIQYQPMVFTVS